ncbi:MAG: TRAP transporter large permease subunit [Lachnospiraceae bacterium]|nr:TRAP transporter large permease subunit [Lachnospiraceae bacterium]
MTAYMITFFVMVGVFMIGCFALKWPVGVSMLAAALCGALEGMLAHGTGLAQTLSDTIRMMVEGEFGYVDTILTIATAMIFMKVIEDSGALDALSSLLIEKFHKVPAVLLILIMFIIMFPGMITGSSTAAVLSAGSIMAPVLLLLGLDNVTAGAIIAMGGILGMIAPPVNTAALVICAGIDVPYVGFTGPLLLLTFPLAILFVLLLGLPKVKNLDYEKLKPALVKQDATRKEYGVKIYIPFFVLVVLMIFFKVIAQKIGVDDLGMPVIFLASAIVGLFTGRKINPLKTVTEAVRTATPVMAILMGVGMFIEIMTATGVRGFIVMTCLEIPEALWIIACCISIPLFGAVSSFGACSVLGVPFAYIYGTYLNGNVVVCLAAISLIASVGDMMPPTALAGLFAAQVTGVKQYTKILKKCIIPIIILLVWAGFILVKSKMFAWSVFG